MAMLGVAAGNEEWVEVEESWGDRWMRFVLDHNPFYLLSAVSMLLGCFLLTSALEVRAGEWSKLMGLLVVINLYEWLLIGLGLYLFLKRGLKRDARLLLILQTLFLADGTFLVSETVGRDVFAGGILNVVMLVMALVKVLVVFRALRLEVSVRTLGVMLVQLAMLYTLPTVLASMSDDGTLSGRVFYPLWWLLFLIPVGYQVLTRLRPVGDGVSGGERSPELRVAYVLMPWVSLVMHVGMLHWVFRAEYTAANLAPMCLAVAVGLMGVRGGRFLPEGQKVVLQVGMCVAAFLLTLLDSQVMVLRAWNVEVVVGSQILTGMGAALVVTWCVYERAIGWVLGGLLAMGLVRWVWPAIREVVQAIFVGVERFVRWAWGLIPETPLGWGVLAVIGSFLLLGMGAVISMGRREAKE